MIWSFDVLFFSPCLVWNMWMKGVGPASASMGWEESANDIKIPSPCSQGGPWFHAHECAGEMGWLGLTMCRMRFEKENTPQRKWQKPLMWKVTVTKCCKSNWVSTQNWHAMYPSNWSQEVIFFQGHSAISWVCLSRLVCSNIQAEWVMQAPRLEVFGKKGECCWNKGSMQCCMEWLLGATN